MSIGGDIADEYWMDYIHRMLDGTGCSTVEELRRKADWAMGFIESDYPDFDKYKEYYSARLKNDGFN